MMQIKRKNRKQIFEFLNSRYGIDKATQILNNFFEKNWETIPGQDIFDILNLIDNNNRTDDNKEISDLIDKIIKNLQHTINELKLLKKKI